MAKKIIQDQIYKILLKDLESKSTFFKFFFLLSLIWKPYLNILFVEIQLYFVLYDYRS